MELKVIDGGRGDAKFERIRANAQSMTQFLRALAHEGRLRILCQLALGERSLPELQHHLAKHQVTVSRQLTWLRVEGLVESRRDGQTTYYRLADVKTRKMLALVNEAF